MTRHTLRPGTTVRSTMTGRFGKIRSWDADFDAYVVRWENYGFSIHCRETHFVEVR